MEPNLENPFEQFLKPLVRGIVLNPNIDVNIRKTDRGVLASVIVDEADQRLVIGREGHNVMALNRLFQEWALRNYQISARLAILEPTGPKPPDRSLSTKADPGTFVQLHAEWLIGELFPDVAYKTQIAPADKGLSDLTITIDQDIEAGYLTSLTQYFRACGRNHGIELQIYIRRTLARSGRRK